MSKHFYRNIKIIKFCKFCGVEYRPARYSFLSHLEVCHKHRNIYYRNFYINYFLPWFKRLPESEKTRYRKMNYKAWGKWVKKNIGKRRLLALASYHRRKHIISNKIRRHRATKKINF